MLMAACAQLVLQMPKFLCKFVIIENVRYYGNRGRSGTGLNDIRVKQKFLNDGHGERL